MCNAWNHPPGCTCGWGGVGHLGTSSGGWHGGPIYARVATVQKISTGAFKWSMMDDLCSHSKCPLCGDSVFFVRHNGGSVWFDSLGHPWPKHACFDCPPLKAVRWKTNSTEDLNFQKSINNTQTVSKRLQKERYDGKQSLGFISEAHDYGKYLRLTIICAYGLTLYRSSDKFLSPENAVGSLVLINDEEDEMLLLMNDEKVKIFSNLPDRTISKEKGSDLSEIYSEGDYVYHQTFGTGTVDSITKTPVGYRLYVRFVSFGFKKIDANTNLISKIK